MWGQKRSIFRLQIVGLITLLVTLAYVLYPRPSSSNYWLSDYWYAYAPTALDQNNLQVAPPDENIISKHDPNRVKAAFVILARNSDLEGIRQSIRQLEDRFNNKYNYPYVFLNEEPFSDEFKQKTTDLTKAKTSYGKIEKDMWGYPDFINQTYAAECRQDYRARKVIYGGSESYRHMCRFQSGFFFRHPLLDPYEYYWRVEPSVNYYCDIDYDVFQMMKDNKFKYGWALSLTEYQATIPTLWNATQEFMTKYPNYIYRGEGNLLNWLTDDNFEHYNGCHFWSNFEIGSLDFFRSEPYLKFFEHLDSKGGFFYERWGDAPVHSLAVAMMLKSSEVHFFNDIGYKHNPLMHCPIEPYLQKNCWCDEKDNFDWRGWSCATRYKKLHEDFVWTEEVYNNKTEPYRYKSY